MKFEIEWSKSEPAPPYGNVCVRERLAGTDLMNEYIMPESVADAFIRARRSFVDRNIRTKFAALKLFSPQGTKTQ